LDTFIYKKREAADEQRIKLGLLPSVLNNYDPFEGIEDPCPTFREIEKRHRATYEYNNIMLARIDQFQYRIGELKADRVSLTAHRIKGAERLEELHERMFWEEGMMVKYSEEYDKTAKMMEMRVEMDRIWRNANQVLKEAKMKFKRTEMGLVGTQEHAEEAWDEAREVHKTTRALIKQQFFFDEDSQAILQMYEIARENEKKMRKEMEEMIKKREEKKRMMKKMMYQSMNLFMKQPRSMKLDLSMKPHQNMTVIMMVGRKRRRGSLKRKRRKRMKIRKFGWMEILSLLSMGISGRRMNLFAHKLEFL